MKYVILIHSNPAPWGHPTHEFTPEGRALPADQRAASDRQFEALMEELSARGEFVVAEALAAPSTSTVLRWDGDAPVSSDGPYAEVKEHLAGFFLVDCATRERAEEVARQFAGPGDVVELRPAMWDGNEGA
ncbi:MAG: YciI family protein [Actinomycetota bacterium]|nr:YciI family protein [Actinomycetota bacterium]